MQDFIHIITTRFNVPTKMWDITRDGEKPLTDEWLCDRFEIFEKFCLPSFQNQTEKKFVWLVFFDVQTPEKYLEKIKRYQTQFSNFHPVYVNDFPDMSHRLLKIIPQFYRENTKFIITSDIDNDDWLHKDYVKEIQSLYQPIHDLVIDLRLGLQLTKLNDQEAKVNLYYQISNPFVSLVENVNDFKTVTKERHLLYRNYPNYIYKDKKPMFIQFIHEKNLVNNTWSNTKRLGSISFQNFGISKKNEFKISVFSAFNSNLKKKIKTLVSLFSIKSLSGTKKN